MIGSHDSTSLEFGRFGFVAAALRCKRYEFHLDRLKYWHNLMTTRPADRRRGSRVRGKPHVLLLALLSIGTGLPGLAASRVVECESTPTETELVEIEIVITQKRCQRRTSHQKGRLPSGIVSAMLSTHSSEPTVYLSATARTEHAFRNGGIGSPLLC